MTEIIRNRHVTLKVTSLFKTDTANSTEKKTIYETKKGKEGPFRSFKL